MISTAQKAMLHVAKATLHLDDDGYRAILRAEAGVTSSSDLDNGGLDRVLRKFRKLGFRPPSRKPTQDSMIQDFYTALGWNTFAQQTGFNRHCCGKMQPVTIGEKSKVILGLQAMMDRTTMFILAWLSARCRRA